MIKIDQYIKDGTQSTYGRDDKCIQTFSYKNTKVRINLEDGGLERNIIFI
jgi:hypothetical protein